MTGAPEEIVRHAARTLMAGRRLDTGTLATELGISRATLFRRAGNRDAILGDALAFLGRRTLAAIEREHDARWAEGGPADRLRSLAVSEDFRYALSAAGPVRRLLAEEPATAIRVLTDPQGRVQPRVVEAYAELFQRDVDEHGLVPKIPVPLLALAVVRLGESFLYSEVLAARAPDLEAATTVIDALVRSVFGIDGT
ncbi:transcriptional regulator [Blastococcus sp. MG754426]|uniref:QsdR family transcriptional regulator n=1 Tax=unclassified Blastococcus TaxID=2619396 RepID=UPI001EEEAF6B|nr:MULTISPECIES: QsdR family transcriptional regulator [unclassified Blastococcus]MCF6506918.1 transcriptional regulator [Blastococcus sp. MG754426]MCF6511836.1 transcriptional regulator [Blastococcus sp. MG754427]